MFRKVCFISREYTTQLRYQTLLLSINTLSPSITCGLKIPSLCLTKTQRPGEQVFQEVHQTVIAKYKRPKAKTWCGHHTHTEHGILYFSLPWIPELAHSTSPFTEPSYNQAISRSRHYLHLRYRTGSFLFSTVAYDVY